MKEVTFKKKFVALDKTEFPEGTTATVTDKHAIWLAEHEFIEKVKEEKKQDKKAASRQTK